MSQKPHPYSEEKNPTIFEIGSGVSWILAAFFLLLMSVPPVLEHVQKALQGKWSETPAGKLLSWRPSQGALLDRLHSVEKSMDGASYSTALRQNLQEKLTDFAGEGNRKVVLGFENMFFYHPDLKALTGYGPLKPEPFSVMKDPEQAKLSGPGEIIPAFAAQLKERGIDLLLVPVPLKPMIYSEYLNSRETREWITHPDAPAFYESLRKQGVDVLDLTAALSKLRGERKHIYYLEANSENREIAKKTEEALKLKKEVFLHQDTHWTVDGMSEAAEQVAAYVKQKYPQSLTINHESVIRAVDGQTRSSMGDLVKLLDLKEPEKFYDEEDQFIKVIGQGTENKYSPVTLLGDSFVNIYDDPSLGFENPDKPMERIHGGFAQNLSQQLQQSLDVIAMNGKGSTGVRRELAKRYDNEVRSKKLVIWVIAARDLLLSKSAAREANVEWEAVKFNPNKSPDASLVVTPVTNAAEGLVIEGKLTEKSKNQEVNGTPYRDALHTAVYDIEKVVSGSLSTKQVQAIQWTFKEKQMQPTANVTVGQRYRLTLVPWEKKTELQTLNMSEDNPTFDPERYFVEKIEEVK
ncbi:hypothetical protein BH11VER1_BH11VER1_26060 [soil metagenome]